MKDTAAPIARLLPVEPAIPFPVSSLRSSLEESKFDIRPYVFNDGDFEVSIITPILTAKLTGQSKSDAS